MKLIQCYIANFGILSNFRYDFQNGINIIKEKNGFGKSTFAGFIKAMFYGLEAKKNTKVLIDRKRYEPWQGGNFGGYIEFEINNKKYKLERYFQKKEADDIFKLYDLETNLECNDFSNNIGEEIFKIDKDAFERSIFISGQNMQTSMNDSINAKLGNILESENDINSSEKAIKILDEAIKNYKKTGNRGEINEKLAEKVNLEHKLEKNKIDEKVLQELKDSNKRLEEALKEKIKLQEEYQNQISILSREEVKKAKIEQYNYLISNCKQNENNLKQYKDRINEKSDIYNQIEDYQNQIKLLNKKNLDINKKIKNKKKIKNTSLVLLILLIILSLIMLICKAKVLFIVISITACIIPIIAFLWSTNYIRKIKEITSLNNGEIDKIESIIDTLNDVNKKKIQEQNIEFERLSKEYNNKVAEIKKFEQENDVEFLLKNNPINNGLNRKEIEEKLEKINKEINYLNDEKNNNKNRIESLEASIDVFEIENEIELISNEIKEMNDKLNILENTKRYLELAKEKFSSHYLNKMEESFIKNIETINGEKIDINLDVNLNAKIIKYGSTKKIDYLSTGYKDLVYICMRLSLVETLFENEEPFIVLDDPFINLDEEKMNKAIELLKSISKNYQIIYFICHESRNLN